MKARELITCVVVSTMVLTVGPVTANASDAVGSGNAVSFHQRLQSIDGLGFAEPFQRATLVRGVRGLSPESTQAILDLLFHRDSGAGASIVRIGIGSSTDSIYDHMKTILPTDPGGPNAEPNYIWDGDDGGQVWFLKQAQRYGVKRFLANAWSAPGFMKTNGTDTNGGQLCGVPDTACASGDWRQAYANYLVQFLRFYQQEGIRITDLGFTNEPDFTASYASMRFTPQQAVDMIKVIGPTLRQSDLGTRLVCCDSFGWHHQEPYSAAIEADPIADRYVSTHTGHMYASRPDRSLPTDDPRWMTEWNPSGNTWNEAWDDGSGWSGIVVAESIHQSFAEANANAYIYWVGTSLGATRGFIQIADGSDGYRVSKRFWAFAAYSRFIRPGAVRVPAQLADPTVKVTAFRNRGGSKVVELLNTGTADVSTGFTTDTPIHRATTYLTDGTHSVTQVSDASLHGARWLPVNLPARSLTTLILH
ncbi:MAG TPA: glycoside hydrolase [Candidatus Limnocylindrales bacterium]|nr:glycoside hydrolase [Candidatus Limnocylindrales bacterium]